jgi:hypothetical protein
MARCRCSTRHWDLRRFAADHGHLRIPTVDDLAKQSMRAGALATGMVRLLAGAVFIWVLGFGHLLIAGQLATAFLNLLVALKGLWREPLGVEFWGF